jgi:hypothetical protein
MGLTYASGNRNSSSHISMMAWYLLTKDATKSWRYLLIGVILTPKYERVIYEICKEFQAGSATVVSINIRVLYVRTCSFR